MRNKSTKLAALGIAVIGVCLFLCVGAGLAMRLAPEFYRYSLENSSLKVGEAAPDFELASLEGDTMRLSQFRGRPVLMSIAASWCPDCRLEAPLLQALHEDHPELVILLVDSKESDEAVRSFAEEFGITHPILLDREGRVMELYRVFAIPTVLFIDSQGTIQAKVVEGVTPQVLAEKLPLIGVSP